MYGLSTCIECIVTLFSLKMSLTLSLPRGLPFTSKLNRLALDRVKSIKSPLAVKELKA